MPGKSATYAEHYALNETAQSALTRTVRDLIKRDSASETRVRRFLRGARRLLPSERESTPESLRAPESFRSRRAKRAPVQFQLSSPRFARHERLEKSNQNFFGYLCDKHKLSHGGKSQALLVLARAPSRRGGRRPLQCLHLPAHSHSAASRTARSTGGGGAGGS